MATCTTQSLVDSATDFCCVAHGDAYWMAKLNLIRSIAGLEATSVDDLIELAKCHIAQWGILRGLEMYMLCIAAES